MTFSLLAQSAGLSGFVWCFCDHGVTLEAPALSACHCETQSAATLEGSRHVESQCECTEVPVANHATLLSSIPVAHRVADDAARILAVLAPLPIIRAVPRPALIPNATAQFLTRHATVQLTI